MLEQPWAPERISLLDDEAYQDAGGNYRWQGLVEMDTEPQEVHAGDEADDLARLADHGFQVVRD